MEPHDFFGLVGQSIDNTYVIQRQVGEGGFGVVYRAEDTGLEVPVAIKCLKIPGHFTPEVHAQFYKKFHEEAKLLAKLSEHSGIVRVYKFGQVATPLHGPVPYLALEWLHGKDLEHVLHERKSAGLPPFSEPEAIALMLPVIDAIAFAHRRNVAHRDLKPANLFVTENEGKTRLRVLDFGIAKVMQEGDSATQMSTKTRSGFSAFSPQYGAPEQFHSKQFGATGPWTDVHALGLIFTDLLVGRAGLGDDAMECALVSIGEERPTPRRFGAATSDAFETAMQQALARSPKARFANADAFHAALCRLTTRSPSSATLARQQALAMDGPSQPAVYSPARTTSAPASSTNHPGVFQKRYSGRTWLAIAAGTAIVAVVILISVWRSRPHSNDAVVSLDVHTDSTPARLTATTTYPPATIEAATTTDPPTTTPPSSRAQASAASATGTLTITTSPPSSCMVNGVPKGKAPVTLTLPPGDYAIVCKAANAATGSDSVKIEAGKASAVQLQLAPASACNPPFTLDADGIKRAKPECGSNAPATTPSAPTPPTPPARPAQTCDPVMQHCQ